MTRIMKKTTIPDSPTELEVARCATDIDLQEEIRRRAYELYEQRRKEDGHDVDDWLQAESELITVATKAAA
jgi:Protein of unknown function (DUF2934)